MPRESFEIVPCPSCANGKVPGQLEQPLGGWPRDEFPADFISVPCPLCHGEGKIMRKLWDKLTGAKRKPVEKKKAEPEKKTGMWDAMKETKRKQEEDWMSQPNFKFRK